MIAYSRDDHFINEFYANFFLYVALDKFISN